MAEANSGVPLLEAGGVGSCTAELLANQWAVTAKHCLWVTGVTYTLKMGTERVTVDRFFVHPTLEVAVVHTSAPLTMNGATTGYQRSLFADDPATLVGQDVACYGYGNDALNTISPTAGKVWAVVSSPRMGSIRPTCRQRPAVGSIGFSSS